MINHSYCCMLIGRDYLGSIEQTDLVMIYAAGRLHNRVELESEMK